jgi:hypothetical protein
MFGGIHGYPLHVESLGTVARIVRIELADTNFLHPDKVETYSFDVEELSDE